MESRFWWQEHPVTHFRNPLGTCSWFVPATLVAYIRIRETHRLGCRTKGKGIVDADKYARSVQLQCPTCGCEQFESDAEEGTMASVTCASCGRAFTKDELIELNSENISTHVEEIKTAAAADAVKEMRDTLRRAFAGSKTITFK
jgi:hypothetical protein